MLVAAVGGGISAQCLREEKPMVFFPAKQQSTSGFIFDGQC